MQNFKILMNEKKKKKKQKKKIIHKKKYIKLSIDRQWPIIYFYKIFPNNNIKFQKKVIKNRKKKEN
jgi:hypothetical protein